MTNSSKKQLKSNSAEHQQQSQTEQVENSQQNQDNGGHNTGVSYAEYIASLEHLRCRIDIMDMTNQTDGDFKHILIYQDDATKFTFLKPLRDAGPADVSGAIIDIFCSLGSTLIVSTRCRDFGREVTNEIRRQWPGCFVVVGRHPSEPELLSFEKCRDRVKLALMGWMDEKRSERWSMGIRFVQWGLNTSEQTTGNESSRHVVIMNERALLGVSSMLHCNVAASVETEEDLINALIAQGN